jgi:hypothetical protein
MHCALVPARYFREKELIKMDGIFECLRCGGITPLPPLPRAACSACGSGNGVLRERREAPRREWPAQHERRVSQDQEKN